mmetsp:Transcript_36965/g.72157  ORF Transcript_36965/g.72157 Transcript_36965/m.72157 type:complete len:247 (+) Transcript_36965:542-1282(+)
MIKGIPRRVAVGARHGEPHVVRYAALPPRVLHRDDAPRPIPLVIANGGHVGHAGGDGSDLVPKVVPLGSVSNSVRDISDMESHRVAQALQEHGVCAVARRHRVPRLLRVVGRMGAEVAKDKELDGHVGSRGREEKARRRPAISLGPVPKVNLVAGGETRHCRRPESAWVTITLALCDAATHVEAVVAGQARRVDRMVELAREGAILQSLALGPVPGDPRHHHAGGIGCLCKAAAGGLVGAVESDDV